LLHNRTWADVSSTASVDRLARNRRLAAAGKKPEDPAVRKPMGEAARRKALAHPLERGFDENLKLYAEVAALKKA